MSFGDKYRKSPIYDEPTFSVSDEEEEFVKPRRREQKRRDSTDGETSASDVDEKKLPVDNDSDEDDLVPVVKTVAKNAPPTTREQVQRFLRPSPVEIAKVKPTAVVSPAPVLSDNLKRLQQELEKDVVVTPSETTRPTVQPVQPVQTVTTCAAYVFRTFTDEGSKWKQTSRLYSIPDLNPDAPVPTSHTPIVLSAECYAQIRIDLSWMPIRPNTGIHPKDFLRGATSFIVLCFPAVVEEKEGKQRAIFTAEVANRPGIVVKHLSNKKSVALDDQVVLQVQMFNGKDTLTHPSKPNGATLFYLDLHVNHLKQPQNYRLSWFATVQVALYTLK
jgi:hypothetical protein